VIQAMQEDAAEKFLCSETHDFKSGIAEDSFQLSEAHQRRNARVLEIIASSTRKLSKKDVYRQYDMIKANSIRSRS